MATLAAPARKLRLAHPDPGVFGRFGTFLDPPARPGQRRDYSFCLAATRADMAPRLHVNHVLQSTLPLAVRGFECHPHAWQSFVPMDVSRYVVVVAGGAPDAEPDLDDAHAFLLPGGIGVAYAPGVWHLGATVLDRAGHFCVLWPRNGGAGDERRATLSRELVVEL